MELKLVFFVFLLLIQVGLCPKVVGVKRKLMGCLEDAVARVEGGDGSGGGAGGTAGS